MSGQEFDLETLHHILGQFSEHVAKDCSNLIKNILKSVSLSGLNDSLNIQNKKAFASVKVLLSLYEKLCTDNNEIKLELPICDILQNIKYILHCSDQNCNFPDDDVQFNVLSIFSSIFKNVLLHSSQDNLVELAELYAYILTCLDAKQECKSDCLIFKLKIIKSIYHALTHVSFAQNEFLDKAKTVNNLDECELFAKLVLHHDDDVAIQTLMYLIPEYVNCFESNRILEVTWKQISNTLTHSDDKYFRALIILCNFFDICFFDNSKLKNKIDLTVLLLEDVNYWKLLQYALIEKDPVKRKQGMFLLKKTIDLLNYTNRNFVCGIKEKIFYWHVDCKNELHEIYSDIIICLEFLEEQQVHIIKPILGKVKTLGAKVIESDKVNFSWVLLLYKKALMHESTQIVKWGLISLLKLPQFFLDEYIGGDTVRLLVDTLNNLGLYYGRDLKLNQGLRNFRNELAKMNTGLFFRLLIKEICCQVWSAEALFFVIHSFLGETHFPCWGEDEISQIGMFVSKAFKTHNKTIRTGIQCELLRGISNLTNTKHVPVESLILLVSKFCPLELGTLRSQAWADFTDFLTTSYSKEKCENVLERYKKQELGPEYNEKFISLLLIVFGDDDYSDSVQNYLQTILLSFREIDKRPYCDKLLHDRYLSVICHIYEANVNGSVRELLRKTLPFVKNIILYIQAQLQQISNLQDFDACELYLNSFRTIIKTLILFETHSEIVSDLYVKILKDSEVCLMSSGISSIGIYWRIKLLSIFLGLRSVKPKPSFLDSYLLTRVNEPLRKESDDSSKTRDLQTLWGKLNSEFLEGKWTILECLIGNKLIIRGPFNTGGAPGVEDDALVKLCVESLNVGGYGILCPVMCVLKDLLPVLGDFLEARSLVDSVWKLIMERRKTEEFKVFVKCFVEMLYQEAFALRGESAEEILFEFTEFIFSDSSLAVVSIFMKHVQQMNLLNCSEALFCHVVGKGLIFGPVQKKDERLTSTVCRHIQFLNICNAKDLSDLNTSNEIRARAVQMVLTLDKVSPIHQTVARKLIETLLKMEAEVNKNRIRYFGNSHVHRVKHRLMQSLLLLEPMLNANEDQAKELSNWLYRCLLTENSQPSVRYMQEWLFVRMLLRHSHSYSTFSMFKCYNEFGETNKRGLCSALAVAYHLCKLTPPELREGRIAFELHEIFSLCFHQHFEIRLYALVVLLRLYNFAQMHNLSKIIENFSCINSDFTYSFKGNLRENLLKLYNDFYFNIFNPLEHYSLETIYEELPKLTNVDSDEWISAETFLGCGVDLTKISVPLKNAETLCEPFSNGTKWLVENVAALEDEKSKVILGNYQKKIIPKKPLIPGWDENATSQNNNVEQDGLIVVASLIDRIPNLGGLARTCEVFGASEYVISSLKYIEDKQFTSLSVTAEKWITVKEVKVQNLLDYISEMKLQGYTVIGAEQMLHSIPLSSAKFPKKSLLLLGNEKEGIPPNFLPLLDVCIEIPQLGIIRSLNVHVTGALFIWEYAKQNNFL